MKSYQIFSYAYKILSVDTVRTITGKNRSTVYGYAAPPTNEIHLRNPIDRITDLLEEIDAAGRGDVARAAIDLMAAPLGGRFEPFPVVTSTKGSVDGEAADAAVALGRFISTCREAVKDGSVSTEEQSTILESLRIVRRELDEIYDVLRAHITKGKGGK